MTSNGAVPVLANYQLRLPSFEGPLDVLLGLIEREQLEVSDLSLVTVTDGFLSYIANLDDPPPSLLAEFAGVAARLLVLKSRALLPRPEIVESEPDVDDLARQLREYQQAKLVAESFRELERAGQRTFVRPRANGPAAPTIILLPLPIDHLRRAIVRMRARARPDPEVAAMRRVISISEMLDRLRGKLQRASGRASFFEMLGSREREVAVVGFIALLALWRRGEAHVEQDGLFADIHVLPAATTARQTGDQ